MMSTPLTRAELLGCLRRALEKPSIHYQAGFGEYRIVGLTVEFARELERALQEPDNEDDLAFGVWIMGRLIEPDDPRWNHEYNELRRAFLAGRKAAKLQ